MKNNLNFLVGLTILTTIVSCGGNGNSKAKLEVTSGFLASNSGFDGGLIITGKNINTGENFSIDIASGVQTQLELPKGSWTFLAVGWDGGPSSNVKFGGKPFCGKTEANLDSASQTVEIDLSVARCGADDSFANPDHKESVPAGQDLGTDAVVSFKKLYTTLTCNSFFDFKNGVAGIDSNTLVSTVLYTKTTPKDIQFCTTLNKMPADLISRVKAFKISAINKAVTQNVGTLGFTSECLQDESDLIALGKVLRLPTKIPLLVQTYEDLSCSKSTAQFPFGSGLEGDYSESFDHVFHTSINGNVLLLPGNDVRRAISPFVHLLPLIQCSSGKCPVEPTTSNTYGYSGYPGSINHIKDTTRDTCPANPSTSITAFPVNGSNFIFNCIQGEKDITITYQLTAGFSGTYDIKINGVSTYVTYIFPSAKLQIYEERRLIQKRLIDLLGYKTESFPRTLLGDNAFQNSEKSDMTGVFDQVREMLNLPPTIIGIPNTNLSFKNSCLASSGSKEITLYDNESLSLNTYKVEIFNPTQTTASGFFCDAVNLNVSTGSCVENFEKEISIFDYKISSVAPAMRIKINCSEVFGKFISFDDETKQSMRRYSRSLISWNTQSISDSRFEKVAIDQEFEVTGAGSTLKVERREMVRFQKVAVNQYAGWDFSFNTNKDSAGSWDQNMKKLQFVSDSSGNSINYDLSESSFTTSNPELFRQILNTTPATLPILAGGTSSTKSFVLISDWAALQTATIPGVDSHLQFNTTHPLINGAANLPPQLDSLKNIEGAFQ